MNIYTLELSPSALRRAKTLPPFARQQYLESLLDSCRDALEEFLFPVRARDRDA